MKPLRLTLSALAAALGCGYLSVASRAENPVAMKTTAPELVGGPWLNTDGKPVSLAARKGRVTIVEFWTFGCSNCQANLPAYERLSRRFAGQDVTLVGVHTPETAAERNPENVKRRVTQLGITYPVLLDGEGKNWSQWKQRYWPTVYIVDKAGRTRFRWEGELEYNGAGGEAKVAVAVEKLLKEPAPTATRALAPPVSRPQMAKVVVSKPGGKTGGKPTGRKSATLVCNSPGKCAPNFKW